jgi:hypothetical protein
MLARPRTTIAVAVALAALATCPAAGAKKSWVAGSIERSTVVNCPSLINGFPYTETGAVANAEAFVDKNRLPRVGQTFYVHTEPGAIGHPCASQAVAVEIVLPRGMKLAITKKTPIRCAYWDIDTRKVTKVRRSGGCPRKAKHGIYGLALRIEVPVRSKRRLKGAAGGPITCGRNMGDPPCSSKSAGDNLQFADHVLDGDSSPWLSPYVPLFVRPKKH